MVLQTIKREDILKNLLSFDHVHPLTGTNPLLLSLALKETDLGEVRSVVDSKVDDYMTNNLKLDKNLQLLSSYIVNQRLTSTTKFAYCACWRGELGNEDEHHYKSMWLAMHHMTVMEEESVETLTVQNDQDDATSTTNEENPSMVKRTQVELPNLWRHIHKYSKNFIDKTDSHELEEVCRKEPSFAGFWFERKFFHIMTKIIQLFLLSAWVETLNQAETLNEASRSKTFQ